MDKVFCTPISCHCHYFSLNGSHMITITRVIFLFVPSVSFKVTMKNYWQKCENILKQLQCTLYLSYPGMWSKYLRCISLFKNFYNSCYKEERNDCLYVNLSPLTVQSYHRQILVGLRVKREDLIDEHS